MYFGGHYQISVSDGGPQVKMFEQVYSDGRQMLLAGGRGWIGGQGQARAGWEGGSGLMSRRGDLYNKVQCIMGNGHMGAPCGQTE